MTKQKDPTEQRKGRNNRRKGLALQAELVRLAKDNGIYAFNVTQARGEAMEGADVYLCGEKVSGVPRAVPEGMEGAPFPVECKDSDRYGAKAIARITGRGLLAYIKVPSIHRGRFFAVPEDLFWDLLGRAIDDAEQECYAANQ